MNLLQNNLKIMVKTRKIWMLLFRNAKEKLKRKTKIKKAHKIKIKIDFYF